VATRLTLSTGKRTAGLPFPRGKEKKKPQRKTPDILFRRGRVRFTLGRWYNRDVWLTIDAPVDESSDVIEAVIREGMGSLREAVESAYDHAERLRKAMEDEFGKEMNEVGLKYFDFLLRKTLGGAYESIIETTVS
jgi:hypothetical protein